MDSRAYHSHDLAFESDRERTNELQLNRYTVLRVTWRQLTREPGAVVARLRRALG